MPELNIDRMSGKTNYVELADNTFKKHGRFIQAMIRFHINDPFEAEDLFQDFFLELVSRPVADDIKDVEGYLYRCLYNNIIDSRRRTQAYKARLRRYAFRHKINESGNSPAQATMNKEEAAKMFRLVKKELPRNVFRALHLRYTRDYDIGQIAKKLKLSRRSVSRYICAGLKKVREFFAYC